MKTYIVVSRIPKPATWALLIAAFLGAQAAEARQTEPAGASAPISLYQPSLVLNQLIASAGNFPTQGGGASSFNLGQVRTFGGNYGAFGAPAARGGLLTIDANPALFSILGTQFGGDGFSDFALPDLSGRTVIGADLGAGTVGRRTGAASLTLTQANLPAHSHSLDAQVNTGVTGSGVAFDKRQPGLDLVQMIAVNGLFPSPGNNTGVTFLGQIGTFSGNFAPQGWLPADGRLLSIAENAALFQILGTTYGGNGRDNFALPNLVGRAAVGAGSRFSLGELAGADSIVLSIDQMPAHTHDWDGGTTGSAGGNDSFANYQASIGINYLVALQGEFPLRDGNGALPAGPTPMLGEVVAFAGNFAPQGWALARGQVLRINENSALFSIFGTQYGGDGSTTFALPDLRDRTIIGAGGGFNIGDKVGAAATFLSEAQLPVHGHTIPDAVPEPASWAMMIAGFGLVGSAVRRRRTLVAAR